MQYKLPLRADGVSDDTAALQERLTAGGLVEIPTGTYLISDTLLIRSNTHLHLQQGAVIRLADGACCCMLKNRASDSGRAGSRPRVLAGGGNHGPRRNEREAGRRV